MTNCAVGSGYADSLDDLGIPPASGGQPFISPDLSATGTISKSGYDITYAAVGTAITGITTCSTVTAATSFYESFAAPPAPEYDGRPLLRYQREPDAFRGRRCAARRRSTFNAHHPRRRPTAPSSSRRRGSLHEPHDFPASSR